MAKYKITFKKSVIKDLRSIPSADVKRILKKLMHLRSIRVVKAVLNCQHKSATEFGKDCIALFMKSGMNTLSFTLCKVAHRSTVYRGT